MGKMTNLEAQLVLVKLRELKAAGVLQKDAAQILGRSISSIRSLCSRHRLIGWPTGAAARDQKGPKNPRYINGKSRAFVNRTSKQVLLDDGRDLFTCERCGHKRDLELPRHHKDRDRKNNTPHNLEVLCVACHNKEHMEERTRSINGTFL